MLEVGQLEDLGWDVGQTIAVETENLQTAGQVGEAARLQRRDAVVVQEPRVQTQKQCLGDVHARTFPTWTQN